MMLLDTVRIKDTGQEVTIVGWDSDTDGKTLAEVAWDTDGIHYKRLVPINNLI